MSDDLAKMCWRLSKYVHAQLSGIDLERIANRIERLEAELIAAEQRGYANAMEAERKLHEERIEELEAKLAKALDGLHEAESAPEPDRHVPEFRHVMDIIGSILAELKRKPS
jgi:uncharacterized protein with von Willebrand factor type A (vWA) domain